jgi:hypothetical protein
VASCHARALLWPFPSSPSCASSPCLRRRHCRAKSRWRGGGGVHSPRLSTCAGGGNHTSQVDGASQYGGGRRTPTILVSMETDGGGGLGPDLGPDGPAQVWGMALLYGVSIVFRGGKHGLFLRRKESRVTAQDMVVVPTSSAGGGHPIGLDGVGEVWIPYR